MLVLTAEDGAATGGASAAISEAQAATRASHVIGAVIEAETEIEVLTAVRSAWTDHILTSQDPRRANRG